MFQWVIFVPSILNVIVWL